MLICLILSLCGCNQKEDFNKTVSNNNEVVIPEKVQYEDRNPIKISIYADNDLKVSDTLSYNWVLKKDIIVLNIFLTEEEKVTGSYYKEIWNKYTSEEYENLNYKLGWEISFEVNDEIIHKTILKPSDSENFYNYLKIYLYDGVHHEYGQWYSHLLDNEITDNTLITSMKLTCGSEYKNITSDIYVKAFTYLSNDDFDDNGYYRGRSFDEVTIKNLSM